MQHIMENNNIITVSGEAVDIQIANLEFQYLENAPDGVLVHNSDGIYIYANATICSMLGYTKNELLGKKHTIILDAVNIIKTHNPFNVSNVIGVHYDEYELSRKDNSKFTSLVTVNKVNDNFLVFIKDIEGYAQSKRELIIAHHEQSIDFEELQRKYSLIVDNLSDGILLFENNAINFISENYCHFLGFDAEELIGRAQKEILNLVHPEDRDRIDKLIQFAVANNLPKVRYEYRIQHKSGSYIWSEDNTSFVYDNQGKMLTCLVVSRDIISRKKAEQDLIVRERKYRHIFDNIQDVYYEISLDGTILEVSPSIYEVTNSLIKREQLIGKSIYDIYHDKYQRVLFLDDLPNSGFIKDYEITMKNVDGSLIECSITAKFVNESEGISPRIIGSFKNITDVKQARQEIVKLNLDLEKRIREKTIELKIAIEDLEIKNQELKTLNHQAYTDSIEILKLNKLLQATHENIEQINIELEHKVKIRTQELEIAKNKAEESDKLKSSFLSNLSHEIRTPLNGIIGCSYLMLDDDNTIEEKQDIDQSLRKSSDRLIKTVEDIIEISLLKTGTAQIIQRKFNPSNLIHELYDLHNNTFHANTKVKLQYNIPEYCKQLFLNSDEQKIYQIMNNLIDNAIKYTHIGIVKFGIERIFDEIEFYVEDTGIGISEEAKNRIFDKFYQEDSGFTRKYEGNGLGLSIANGYVKILGGEMHVNSQQGVGSRFAFTISLERGISV